MRTDKNKTLPIEALARRLEPLRAGGSRLVLCHGCFDLMHPGHIKYFQAASRMGDILMVTVTPDRFIDKGAGRPVFDETLRCACIAALECVDFVSINAWPTAEETLRLLRPHVYVKGQEFKDLQDKTGKIQRESEVAREIGAAMAFTSEIVFSSTKILTGHLLQEHGRE